MNVKTLKLIAIITMLIDHIAWAFVPMESVLGLMMHSVGRIAAPIMFYFIAEGYRHTRSPMNYAARLAILAVISQIPYTYFWAGKLPVPQNTLQGNVIFTLLFGLLALWACDTFGIRPLTIGIVVGLCAVAIGISCDWSCWGIIYILIFGLSKSYKKQAMLFTIVSIIRIRDINNFYQIATLAALPLINSYNGKRGNSGKWFFYVSYPLHLFIIGFIRWVVLS